MKNSRHRFIFIFFFTYSLLSCEKQEDAPPHLVQGHLIGGEKAKTNQYKSTIQIHKNCTASKISRDKFILAAHCLIDMKTLEIKAQLSKERYILLKTHYSKKMIVNRIKNYFIHPSYLEELTRRVENNLTIQRTALKSFDIAIIQLDFKTEEIPITKISYDHLEYDDEVLIGGYGCTTNIDSKENGQYKISKNIVVKDELSDEKFTSSNEERAQVEKYNFLTIGQKKNDLYASICPGDSGGPVYRLSDQSIVGVNSYYTFLKGTRISYFNIHTRISVLKDWIENILSHNLR